MGRKIDTLKEQQDIELSIMKDLHTWFEENNIRYCMGYGTLLGAVRHQGFIPWDNDMDILMPRPDFERMLRLAKDKSINGYINILHHSVDDKYHYSIVRACDNRTKVYAQYLVEQPRNMGLWVDIFPIDGMPDDRKRASIREWIYKKLQRVDIYANRRQPATRIVKNVLRSLFPNRNNHHMQMIDKIATRVPFEKAEYVADMVEMLPIKMKRSDFENRVLMKYEDTELYAPKEWDSYLKRAYGDYMTLPPAEKRATHIIDVERIG